MLIKEFLQMFRDPRMRVVVLVMPLVQLTVLAFALTTDVRDIRTALVDPDNTPESPSAYALCYSCHSRNSILADESFQGHDLHIREQRTPCSVCHDAHGVSAVQGNPMNNSHLINFDTTIVQPNSAGILRYSDEGRYRGSCDLLCHGRDHQTEGYAWR
jgi:hypothetical protein